ncbi:MAG: glutamine synthetase family protein [Pseudomonadota bacterium]|nr:glutamine synthetase family protein [Pseudomonadota bacterium]
MSAGKVPAHLFEHAPMTTAEEWLASRKIDLVECLVPDIHGVSKGKIVPAEDLAKGGIRLPEAIFGQDVIGGWSENHDLFDVADIDMLLIPDATTLIEQPWSTTKTAQCICDCETLEGAASTIAPRTILKHILELFHVKNLNPVVAQEAEFYLVEKNSDPTKPIQAATGTSGRQQKTPRSFQTEALAEFSPFLERLYEYSKGHDIETAGVVSEMGCGQLEINFRHGDPLRSADGMFNFKRIARQAAMEQGYHATFLSKPMSHEPGSAMHLHQSIVEAVSGDNLFSDNDGEYSEQFYAYLGGLQRYTPHVMAFLAPYVNSYRRFEDAESCPTNTQWGIDNRTTGFRIPRSNADSTRIENRIPGSDTNSYLAIAASLACGYLGIQEGLRPSKPIIESAWDLERTLPRSLHESLELLLQCEPIIDLLGERFVNVFVDLKARELSEFSSTVTTWERQHLLLTV